MNVAKPTLRWTGPHRCPSCGAAMLRLRYYDPDGDVPVEHVNEINGDLWVCIARGCEHGSKNVVKV